MRWLGSKQRIEEKDAREDRNSQLVFRGGHVLLHHVVA